MKRRLWLLKTEAPNPFKLFNDKNGEEVSGSGNNNRSVAHSWYRGCAMQYRCKRGLNPDTGKS